MHFLSALMPDFLECDWSTAVLASLGRRAYRELERLYGTILPVVFANNVRLVLYDCYIPM